MAVVIETTKPIPPALIPGAGTLLHPGLPVPSPSPTPYPAPLPCHTQAQAYVETSPWSWLSRRGVSEVETASDSQPSVPTSEQSLAQWDRAAECN